MLTEEQKREAKERMKDFSEGYKPTNLFRRIQRELDSPKIQRQFERLDQKRASDWGILCNQVIGQEIFPEDYRTR